jgi:hypothetical protein
MFLRDQINKCKWFFNKLATSNPDAPNGDFLSADLLAVSFD